VGLCQSDIARELGVTRQAPGAGWSGTIAREAKRSRRWRHRFCHTGGATGGMCRYDTVSAVSSMTNEVCRA
jgi:hypothetical protein